MVPFMNLQFRSFLADFKATQQSLQDSFHISTLSIQHRYHHVQYYFWFLLSQSTFSRRSRSGCHSEKQTLGFVVYTINAECVTES